MTIGGVSIIMALGVINFVLLSFQLATGLRWIKVGPSYHRRAGILLVITGTVHGALAVIADLL